jgi:hypothetical protein
MAVRGPDWFVLQEFCALLIALSCFGCARAEPPGVPGRASATKRNVGIAVYDTSIKVQTATTTIKGLSTSTSQMPLIDAGSKPLSQTDQLPSAEDPIFHIRIAALCKAILDDSPEIAHTAFFPMEAYRLVKAVADPDRDYRLRLLAHFDRDVATYHRRLGRLGFDLHCNGIVLGEGQARWMKPGSEYNRLGYYRVLRSRLRFSDSRGAGTSLEITSMISWRGQWYVVHLDGFE